MKLIQLDLPLADASVTQLTGEYAGISKIDLRCEDLASDLAWLRLRV